MKIWYFHGQYITNGLVTNEISYNLFDLSHMRKSDADVQKKNEAAVPYFEPCQISMMEHFLKKYNG